jgi:hypothetical protein
MCGWMHCIGCKHTWESFSISLLNLIKENCVLGAKLAVNVWVDILQSRCYLKSIHKLILLNGIVNLLFHI